MTPRTNCLLPMSVVYWAKIVGGLLSFNKTLLIMCFLISLLKLMIKLNDNKIFLPGRDITTKNEVDYLHQ